MFGDESSSTQRACARCYESAVAAPQLFRHEPSRPVHSRVATTRSDHSVGRDPTTTFRTDDQPRSGDRRKQCPAIQQSRLLLSRSMIKATAALDIGVGLMLGKRPESLAAWAGESGRCKKIPRVDRPSVSA